MRLRIPAARDGHARAAALSDRSVALVVKRCAPPSNIRRSRESV
jgi:hypothetical protein